MLNSVLPCVYKPLWLIGYHCLCILPFQSLRKASMDKKLLRLCVMVFLSYLPEAGQYSCFFLYLRQVSIGEL